jgi:hypothetical protein
MENSAVAAEEQEQFITEDCSSGTKMKNSSESNEKLTERRQKSSTSKDGKDAMNGPKTESSEKNRGNKESEKASVFKRRPLSTKSTRSNDSNDRGKKLETVISAKGKYTVKRRSSSSDVIKGKGHVLSKKISKKPETLVHNAHTSTLDCGLQPTDSKVRVNEDTVKLQDQEVRLQSSSSKYSEKTNINGYTVADRNGKTVKSKVLEQENKSKTFGIKKSWQKLKSAKVNGKCLITSQGNGSLPLSNDVKPNQDTENLSTDEVANTKDKIAERSKTSSEVQENLSPDFIQSSLDCHVLANDESSQLSADPVIQYGNGAKYNDEDRTKSFVSSSDPWIHSAIPYLPLELSVICLVMNIIIPGSGKIFPINLQHHSRANNCK